MRRSGRSLLTSWTDFPGYFAGASLKVEQWIGIAPSAYGLPRLLRRGLIEGDTLWTHRPVVWGGLPRLLRRGLIEAGARRRRRPMERQDFPGYFAGASLKRCV